MTSKSLTIYAYICPRRLLTLPRPHSTTSTAKSPSRPVTKPDRDLAGAILVEAEAAIAEAPDSGPAPDAPAEAVVLCFAFT